MGIRKWFVVCCFTLSLMGCGAMTAQNPGGTLSPVNAVQLGQVPRVMLHGADVVAYFVEGAPRDGRAEFSSMYQNVTYWFSSAEHKAMFEQAPERYQPQYGGYCANGIAFGIPWGGNSADFKMINGKLYIFGGELSKAAFELDESKNLELADFYWRSEIQGHNSFVQRAKRLVFRVPHYQTGAEQQALVDKARATR